MNEIGSVASKSDEEQKQTFCLNDYLTDAFNYKSVLRRGQRIKPVIFRLSEGAIFPARKFTSPDARADLPLGCSPRKCSCPNSPLAAARGQKQRIERSKSGRLVAEEEIQVHSEADEEIEREPGGAGPAGDAAGQCDQGCGRPRGSQGRQPGRTICTFQPVETARS